jgi:hypothetical protein
MRYFRVALGLNTQHKRTQNVYATTKTTTLNSYKYIQYKRTSINQIERLSEITFNLHNVLHF